MGLFDGARTLAALQTEKNTRDLAKAVKSAQQEQRDEAARAYQQQLAEWRAKHEREKAERASQPAVDEGALEELRAERERVQWCIDRIIRLESEVRSLREQLEQRPAGD